MHALLVEDSVLFAEALRLLLAEAGNREVQLTHVEELADVEAASEPRPDVVLLDLCLPDGEGVDSLKAVQHALPGIPIVVLTGDADEEQALQMVREGAQDYLVKGRFNVDTLVRAMRYAIERAQCESLKCQLHQADRLAALGKLAAGVAHEISNPATFVQASTGLLQNQLDQAATAVRQAIEEASAAGVRGLQDALHAADSALTEIRRLTVQNAAGVERICTVVQDLRGYSRLEASEVTCVHPNEVVTDVCNLVSNVVRHKARLIRDLGAVLPVALPRGRLDQILTNLLVNAAQAIPDGSPESHRVTVTTRQVEDAVVVAVEDTGPGMTTEQQKRVFEPFFTTKPRGVGTGLGLSICREIAEAHGGSIRCQSRPGEGTRFEVRLPVIPDPELRYSTVPPSLPRVLDGRGRVLLIDDEPNIREVYKLLLGDEFEMQTASNGRQALELMATNDYDVVVSDVMMPDMDAAQLLEAISATRPILADRFILYTGGAVSGRARTLIESSHIPVLYKPLLTDDLKTAIRQRMAGAEAPPA